MNKTMQITVNGETKEVNPGITFTDLLTSLAITSTDFGFATLLNGELIEKSSWDAQLIKPNDRIDLLRAFQGG
ncbi:MAG: sulfur carrier protein ThiS [Deltaproteobacteria bacterium]|nr:sulfur carrier protein ThiS [Deltaproteobacteria bacterium]